MKSRKRRRAGRSRTKRHRRRLTYSSFVRALEERSGLRQTNFAVPKADFKPVTDAKQWFTPLATGRFVAAVLRALMRLMRSRKGA